MRGELFYLDGAPPPIWVAVGRHRGEIQRVTSPGEIVNGERKQGCGRRPQESGHRSCDLDRRRFVRLVLEESVRSKAAPERKHCRSPFALRGFKDPLLAVLTRSVAQLEIPTLEPSDQRRKIMGLHRDVGPGAVLGSGAEGLPVTLKREDARRQNASPS